jgi:TolB-like protein
LDQVCLAAVVPIPVIAFNRKLSYTFAVEINGKWNIQGDAMKKISRILRVFLAAVTAILQTYSALQAQYKPVKKINIAVLDFDSREGVSKGEAASLSDIFCSQLVQTGKYVVVDRNRIKTILNEQGFQQSEACSSVECIVEAGKILKVEKIFAGVIGKIGRLYTINIQMIDVSTAQIQINKNRQHDGDVEDLALKIIPDLAAEMTSELTGEEVTAEQMGGSSTNFKRHEFYAGAGTGNGETNQTFQGAPDIGIRAKGIFTAAYFFNFNRYFAAGIRIQTYHDNFDHFPVSPTNYTGGMMSLEVNCNVASLEGRFIFIRSAIEPYASLILVRTYGNMGGNGDKGGLQQVQYSGGGGGVAVGFKLPIFNNFGIAVDGRAIGASGKWENRNPDVGFFFSNDEFKASYRAVTVMLFGQF